MPVHPDCCDPIHILIAGRAGQFGGVAGAATDASHPDLSILERRRSAKIASELCGQVAKIKGSYTISETSKRAGVSPLSGRAGGSGGGSIGATKSFQERREAVFHPRDFTLLGNCQAICLPYDGAQSLEPRRVYLKPHYLPLDHSYWRAKEAGQI